MRAPRVCDTRLLVTREQSTEKHTEYVHQVYMYMHTHQNQMRLYDLWFLRAHCMPGKQKSVTAMMRMHVHVRLHVIATRNCASSTAHQPIIVGMFQVRVLSTLETVWMGGYDGAACIFIRCDACDVWMVHVYRRVHALNHGHACR